MTKQSINNTNHLRNGLVILGLALSLALIFFDQTVIPVAIPAIQHALSLTADQVRWVVNLYAIMIVLCVIVAGKLGDAFGQRRILLLGLVIFAVASLCCSLSDSGWILAVSRAWQGIGAACFIPLAAPLLLQQFSSQRYGLVTGIYVGIASGAQAFGSAIGGILVKYINWQSVFWFNVPVCLLSILLICLYCQRDQLGHTSFQLPIKRCALFALSILCLIVPVMLFGSGSNLPTLVLIMMFLAGLLLLLSYLYLDNQANHPFIHFVLFRQRGFLMCNVILLCSQAIFSLLIFWSILLQQSWHMGAFKTGMILMSATVPTLLIAPIGGHMMDRFGARMPIMIGLYCLIIGLVELIWLLPQHHVAILLPGFILFGIGMPLIFNSAIITSLRIVTVNQRGQASGINTTLRQLGSSLGFAVLAMIMLPQAGHALTKIAISAMQRSMVLMAGLALCALLVVLIWRKSLQ